MKLSPGCTTCFPTRGSRLRKSQISFEKSTTLFWKACSMQVRMCSRHVSARPLEVVAQFELTLGFWTITRSKWPSQEPPSPSGPVTHWHLGPPTTSSGPIPIHRRYRSVGPCTLHAEWGGPSRAILERDAQRLDMDKCRLLCLGPDERMQRSARCAVVSDYRQQRKMRRNRGSLVNDGSTRTSSHDLDGCPPRLVPAAKQILTGACCDTRAWCICSLPAPEGGGWSTG